MGKILEVDLWKAQKWYKSGNEALIEIATSLYTEKELLGEETYKREKEKQRIAYEAYKREQRELEEEARIWENAHYGEHW